MLKQVFTYENDPTGISREAEQPKVSGSGSRNVAKTDCASSRSAASRFIHIEHYHYHYHYHFDVVTKSPNCITKRAGHERKADQCKDDEPKTEEAK